MSPKPTWRSHRLALHHRGRPHQTSPPLSETLGVTESRRERFYAEAGGGARGAGAIALVFGGAETRPGANGRRRTVGPRTVVYRVGQIKFPVETGNVGSRFFHRQASGGGERAWKGAVSPKFGKRHPPESAVTPICGAGGAYSYRRASMGSRRAAWRAG